MKVKQHKMMPVLIAEQLYIYIYLCFDVCVFKPSNRITFIWILYVCLCVHPQAH